MNPGLKYIRQLNTFTYKEKAEAFDELHAFAIQAIKDAKERGTDDMDIEHYAFEEVMKLTLGPNVFDYWNKL